MMVPLPVRLTFSTVLFALSVAAVTAPVKLAVPPMFARGQGAGVCHAGTSHVCAWNPDAVESVRSYPAAFTRRG